MMINYSFIIPHKNTPTLLQRCLDSIPQRDDVEIIVVDNNSSSDIVDFSHYPGSNRAIILRDNNSVGPGGARNTGLKIAKGKWVLFADADDYYSVGFLDILDRYILSDVDVVYFNLNMIKDGHVMDFPLSLRYLNNYDPEDPTFAQMIKLRFPGPVNKMTKREFLLHYNIRFKDCVIGEDGVFSFQVGFHSNYSLLLESKIYNCTINPNSITNKVDNNGDYYKCLFRQKYQYNEFYKYVNHREWELSVIKGFLSIIYKKGFRQFLLAMGVFISNRKSFIKDKMEIVDIIKNQGDLGVI